MHVTTARAHHKKQLDRSYTRDCILNRADMFSQDASFYWVYVTNIEFLCLLALRYHRSLLQELSYNSVSSSQWVAASLAKKYHASDFVIQNSLEVYQYTCCCICIRFDQAKSTQICHCCKSQGKKATAQLCCKCLCQKYCKNIFHI